MKVPGNFTAGATRKSLADAINSNFTGQKEEQAETKPKTVKKEVKEKFLVSLSEGERSQYKAFCALKGISMNHFVVCAMDFLKEEIEAGNVSISPHGYKRKEQR